MPAGQIDECRAATLEWNLHELDAGLGLKELAHQMRQRTVASVGCGQTARFGFSERDQFGHRLRRHGKVRHEQHRRGGKHGNRPQLLDPEGHFLHVRHDGEQARNRYEQGISIGCRLRDQITADYSGSAGPVLHHHRLADLLGEFLRSNAPDSVENAAGGVRMNELDRTRRKILRERRNGHWAKARENENESKESHGEV